jgi:phosphate transport system protein
MPTRQSFDQDLIDLQQELLKMASLVEEAIFKGVQSLAKQDLALAQQVIDGDDLIDQMEINIEERCMKLIALQQPAARDLRVIGTALRIIADLERMADHATDIAKTTQRLAGQPLIKPLVDIPRMAVLAQKMLKDSIDAYVHLDVALAEQIGRDDDAVDALYSQVFRELLTYMIEDPQTIGQATQLIFVGRYLERIADHAQNIAEWIVYLVTGERKKFS